MNDIARILKVVKKSSQHYRLGNSALLNQKSNASIKNDIIKQMLFKASPYPLTTEITEHATWSVATVQQHHARLVKLACIVWDLRSVCFCVLVALHSWLCDIRRLQEPQSRSTKCESTHDSHGSCFIAVV